nr:bifunctional diguanylate cyclase/phosphodiesterase [Streptomyces otsuchiensis]
MALAAICAAYAAGAALGWGSERLALVMGDFGLSAAALLAATSCLWYARTRAGEFRPAWILFGLSSLMVGVGNAIWGWYEVILREPVPRISLADVCFLLFAPLAIVGLLMLAKRPVSRAGWLCLGLDASLIAGSLLTLSWSVALTHTAQWQGETVIRATLALAYPLLDIALVSMVLVLHFRRTSAQRSAVNTAVGALSLTVLCDALFTSPLLRDQYTSGQLLDAGWFAGSLLLACAPWTPSVTQQAGRLVERSPVRAAALAGVAPSVPVRAAVAAGAPGALSRRGSGPPPAQPLAGSLASLTPYLAAAVCTLSILITVIKGREVDPVVVATACAVVLALLVRQGIMLRDNIVLTGELAQQESHFRSLVQGSSDVIMIAAPDGVLRYVSPAAAGVYGQDADQLVGRRLSDLIHADDLGRVEFELRRFLSVPAARETVTRVECRVQHGAGRWLNVESSVNRHQNGLIFNSRDVTERVRLQAQLQHSASHDSLTDLPNRALFTERVRQAVDTRRSGERTAAVFYIDLDGFKAVNDTAGHQTGDELLVQAARRLRESVRAGDTTARLGGDEFAALLTSCPAPGEGGATGEEVARDRACEAAGRRATAGRAAGDGSSSREEQVLDIAERVRAALSRPYLIDGHEVRVAASIGIAFATPGCTPAELLRDADIAMYRAKQAGKGRVELYTPGADGRGDGFATAAGRRADGPGSATRPASGPSARAGSASPDGAAEHGPSAGAPPTGTPSGAASSGAAPSVRLPAAGRRGRFAAGPTGRSRGPLPAARSPLALPAVRRRPEPPSGGVPSVPGEMAGRPGAGRAAPVPGRRAERAERPSAVLHQPVVALADGAVVGLTAVPAAVTRTTGAPALLPHQAGPELGGALPDDRPDGQAAASGGPGHPSAGPLPPPACRGSGRACAVGESLKSECPQCPERAAIGVGAPSSPPDGRRLLELALSSAAARRTRHGSLPVTVPLPAGDLDAGGLEVEEVAEMLDRHDLPAHLLTVEIPDANRCLDAEEPGRRLARLRGLGVGIALTGLGDGRVPLLALHRLPVTEVRLARELVGGLPASPELRAIVAALLGLSEELGVTAVADGVDHPEQVAALRALGCPRGRGAALGGPLSDEALEAALRRGRLPLPGEGAGPRAASEGARGRSRFASSRRPAGR